MAKLNKSITNLRAERFRRGLDGHRTEAGWAGVFLALSLCLVLCLVLGACGEPVGPSVDPTGAAVDPIRHPTPEETRAEFEAVCHRLEAGDNEYWGRAQIADLEQTLAGALGRPMAPTEAVALEQELAGHLLRLGRNSEAAERLNHALQTAAQARLPPRTQLQILGELGLALLRIGEVKNCTELHSPEMCLFPIQEGGRHQDPRPAQDAARALTAVLEGAPDHTLSKWLLNVAAMTTGAYPEGVPAAHRVPPERLANRGGLAPMPDVAMAAGLHIQDTSGGVAVEDFDGDGLLDIVTSAIDPCSPLRFFVNDGRGGFEDRAGPAGLEGQLGGLNLIHGDYDNDGHEDLLVLRGGWLGADGRMRNSLLRNDGDGTFTDVTAAAGLAAPAYPTQTAAWADYDLDGDLDLYVGNESGEGGVAYPSQLFRNEGGAQPTFVDVASVAGITNDRMAKGVAWGDLDDDGDPDLYVSNIGPNRLFLNRGDGTFEDIAPRLELTEPEARSFATWFFDYDNDGDLDLFVADYSASPTDVAAWFLAPEEPGGAGAAPGHPLLYRNDGLGEAGLPRWTEVSQEVGLRAPALAMGSSFGDVDGDGFLDIYLGTGLPEFEALTPNLLYRSVAADGGRHFEDVTFSARVGHLQKGHGVAFADFDEDGDQDLFEQMGGAFPGDAYPSVLYRNPGVRHPGADQAWLQLRLVGREAPRSAFGARVRLEVEGPSGSRTLFRTVGTGGSFGATTLRLELGLGDAGDTTAIRLLEVTWPSSGLRQKLASKELERLELNRAYEWVEGEAAPEPLPRASFVVGKR